METIDRKEMKSDQKKIWKAAASGWLRRDEILRKGTAPVTERMLTLAKIKLNDAVLDIASGTGEPAISAAQIVGNDGRVIGTDLVDEMLSIARDKAKQQKLNNIEFQQVDGETLDFAENSFDAVTIRWGLMFMPEPEKCLIQARNVLKKNGRVVIACWANPERNPFINLMMETLSDFMTLPVTPENTPSMYAFANPARLREVIISAGFNDVKLEELELNVLEVADGCTYWDVISDLAAPVVALVNQLDTENRKKYVSEVIKSANALKQGDMLQMKGTTWIATATR